MTPDPHDHARLVEAWLKEPVWLSDGDTARIAQLVHQTPQQRGWLRPFLSRSTHDMITVIKFATAGIVLAATGWLLLAGGLSPQAQPGLPGASPSAATSAGLESAAPDVTTDPDASAEPEASVAPASSVAPEASGEGVLVLGAPENEAAAAGWSQAGSAPFATPAGTGFGGLDRFAVAGGRLLALGSVYADVQSEVGRDAVLHSTDGMTWVPVLLPGRVPELEVMAATDDGVIVGGRDRVGGEAVARLWSSTDGLTWVEVPAPAGARVINQIVSPRDPLAVRANLRIYQQEADGSWTDLGRIPNSQILKGPSGYITWQGGGQDRRLQLSMTHKAELGGKLREIGLPGRLGRGNLAEVGVQLFAVDDLWVMVPEGVDSPPLYVSSDGFEWTEVPRPDRMLGESVGWMTTIGEDLQAFGIQYRQSGSRSGVWTIDLASSEPAPFEAIDGDGRHGMGTPVAFADSYFAPGFNFGPGNSISVWQHEAE